MSDYKYFSYCPINEFEFHKTAEEAETRANEMIENYLGLDGDWDISVEQVCWGEIKGIATKHNIRPDEAGVFDFICEYKLKQPN